MKSRTALGARAKQFRQYGTAAERTAWELLRARRCLGLKFRRQHVIHGRIADFYCHELQLVLELDGAVHETAHQTERDAERTDWLRVHGLTILRLPNEKLSHQCLLALLSPYCSPQPAK